MGTTPPWLADGVGVLGDTASDESLRRQLESVDVTVTQTELADWDGGDALVHTRPGCSHSAADVAERARDAEATLVTIRGGGLTADSVATVGLFPPTGACPTCLDIRLASHDNSLTDESIDPAVAAHAGTTAGFALLQHPPNEDSTAPATVIDLSGRRLTVLPVPGCPTCDTAWRGRWDGEPTGQGRSLEKAVAAAETAVDDRVGLIAMVGEVVDEPLPYYLAQLADTSGFSDVQAPRQAAGVNRDWNTAYMKAAGEALERYAAGVYRTDTLTNARPSNLNSAVHPDEFVRPSDREPVTEPIHWVNGRSLRDGTPVHLPADVVCFPPPDRVVRPAITTGLGLGNTITEARLTALLEVVERDAAMLAWYTDADLHRIELPEAVLEPLAKRSGLRDLSVETVLLTRDIDVPVVAAILHRADDWPRLAMGAAADLDATAAATDAIGEALQNWTELDQMGQDRAADEAPRITRYAGDPDPVLDRLAHGSAIPAASLSESLPDDPAARLDCALEAVHRVDCHSYSARLTTRDLESLRFEAVRVVIPSAQPLTPGEMYFGERALSVPSEFGETPRLDREPHPFP